MPVAGMVSGVPEGQGWRHGAGILTSSLANLRNRLLNRPPPVGAEPHLPLELVLLGAILPATKAGTRDVEDAQGHGGERADAEHDRETFP